MILDMSKIRREAARKMPKGWHRVINDNIVEGDMSWGLLMSDFDIVENYLIGKRVTPSKTSFYYIIRKDEPQHITPKHVMVNRDHLKVMLNIMRRYTWKEGKCPSCNASFSQHTTTCELNNLVKEK